MRYELELWTAPTCDEYAELYDEVKFETMVEVKAYMRANPHWYFQLCDNEIDEYIFEC